ncbi:MAG TPA: TetR/AcrR family transcriptional regulator [Candidatus Avamphibacillus sp.]|nr:TetR/AcrR family transcriptional regulator [Candidatus Avamphibacillus sp.]
MTSKAYLKRRLILDATKQIILDHGLRALTLDGVAEKANISKGGLLYHFPNKESLIKGLAQYIFDEYSNQFYKYAENDPNETGKWTRSLIKAAKYDLEHNGELNAAILATSSLEADIAKQISKSYDVILKKLENDKINPVTANIIRLALDGIYYSKMLNIAPLEKEKINEVIQPLLEMTEGGES